MEEMLLCLPRAEEAKQTTTICLFGNELWLGTQRLHRLPSSINQRLEETGRAIEWLLVRAFGRILAAIECSFCVSGGASIKMRSERGMKGRILLQGSCIRRTEITGEMKGSDKRHVT